jgi:hydroxymethylpyrimidine/phosphomethylpyrimidine kinase
MTPPVALTVAGTDSGGAAGIAADLTTFAAFGVHGACVVTAVTAQDTLGVRDVHRVPVASVAAQLDAVLGDLPVAAVKTGMLGCAEIVVCLRNRLDSWPGTRLVVDPVLVATSGSILGDEMVRDAYVEHLLPVASVVTPNLDEARALATAAGLTADSAPPDLAAALATLGSAVVLTGGGEQDDGTCTDWLATPGGRPSPLRHPALPTRNDHGTGCTFSAALACGLAHGAGLPTAVERAASYTTRQLHLSSTWDLGRGRGPVAHAIPTTRGEST